MANCMSVLHDLEQHPTSLFSSLLNGVSMDGLSCATWCHHLLPNLSTKSLLHCDRRPPLGGRTRLVNVNNFHGSLTTVAMALNDTSKTENITDTIFDRTYLYSPYKRWRFENWSYQTFCILLITDVLSVIESANLRQRQNLKQK